MIVRDEKLGKLVSEDDNVKYLSKVLGKIDCKLVGGAPLDIIQGMIPKDYDLIVTNLGIAIDRLTKAGFTYYGDSKTASTFMSPKGMIVQLLKTKIEDFEYTISQTNYSLSNQLFHIDKLSWDNKLLIPNKYENKIAKECLFRIPHWKNKGFRIPDHTYFSLLNAAYSPTSISTGS